MVFNQHFGHMTDQNMKLVQITSAVTVTLIKPQCSYEQKKDY